MTATRSRRGAFEGWWLFAGLAVAILLVEAAILLHGGYGEESLRGVVRASARISVSLFCLAFAASSLQLLLHPPLSAWLLRNRRALGVAFGFCHGTHALALLLLARDFPSPFVDEVDALTLVFGGFAYVVLLAMVATSSDAAQRALGMRRWRLLHKSGSYYLWFIFFLTYAPLAVMGDGIAVLASALLLGAVSLRLAAFARGQRGGLSEGIPAGPR